MKCPRCNDSTLNESKYEGIEIDTCSACNGAWLANHELTHIVQVREVKFTDQIVNEALSSAKGGIPKSEANHDLNCPVCQESMKPINYGVSSGIIIDRCTQDHGLWFDGSELEKVQAYREHWQDHTKENENKLHDLIKDVKGPENDKSPSLLFAAAEFLSKYL